MLTAPRMSLAIVALLLGYPCSVRADPITLTGGNVQVEVNLKGARVNLEGDGFFVRTVTEDFFAPIANWPFPLATPVNLGGLWRPTSTPAAAALFNGVLYPSIDLGFGTSGTFTTPSMTLTAPDPLPVGGRTGDTTISLPFTFTGQLVAFDSFNTDTELFRTSLVGSGTATARFRFTTDGEVVLYTPARLVGKDYQLDYFFSRVSAVPEPGTLLLLSTGGLAIVMRRRVW
jgi:hypothetical protein